MSPLLFNRSKQSVIETHLDGVKKTVVKREKNQPTTHVKTTSIFNSKSGCFAMSSKPNSTTTPRCYRRRIVGSGLKRPNMISTQQRKPFQRLPREQVTIIFRIGCVRISPNER